MRHCVCKRERAAPRPAQHEPASDVQALTQQLDVGEEVPGGIAREVGVRRARVRLAASATALVEEDYAVGLRVEEPPLPRRTARPGAAVQDDGRLALRIPARLPVHEVAVAHVEQAVLVRLDLTKTGRHDEALNVYAGCPAAASNA